MNTTTPLQGSLEHKISQIKKAKKYIFWILGISWAFGFTALHLMDSSNIIHKAIITLIYGFLPATLALILNKKEGGNWKDLKFIKPTVKSAILAFIIPILYFGTTISIQVVTGIRTSPDWSMIGSIKELLFALGIGYPAMMLLILGEEIGWRGYLQEKLQDSFGALKGILILGLVWGFWHLPIALEGYNFPNHPYIEAFITYPLVGMALSLLIAYLGFNSYSIFIGVILHASNNHFGSILLLLTEANNEFAHAMIFNLLYILIILIFGFLVWKKTLYNKQAGF
ncbi:MAG: type II CAAX endopeptidase family protein [Flavobacteriaceae bacterium]